MHFRDTEIRIVSEAAWTYGSPVVEVIQEVQKSQKAGTEDEEQKI